MNPRLSPLLLAGGAAVSLGIAVSPEFPTEARLAALFPLVLNSAGALLAWEAVRP